uniref:LysR family transcriptional regulator n=1 Tax=Chitinimonas sp. TaxID=1934313 RepID=UPI0035B495E3
MQLKLDQMAIFAQVCEAGSFTAAAALLHLPKSTVSQRVAELEDALGIRLLQRSTRRLSLTEAGQIYLGHCKMMLDAANAADAAVSRLRDSPSGSLRLTVPEATGICLMPDLLCAFRLRYPQVTVHCEVSDARLDLLGERIDLAFRTGKLDDSSYVSRRIGQVRRVLVASPGYLALRGTPASSADLLAHNCLVHSAATQWRLQTGPVSETITPAGGFSSNSLLSLLNIALRDGGIAMLPAFLCRTQLASGSLREVLPEQAPAMGDYYAIYPS